MARLSFIDIYPPTGHPDRLWSDPHEDPILDAFVRSARCVCELFSEALTREHLDAFRSMFRIVPSTVQMHRRHDLEVVELGVWIDKPHDSPGEMGWLHLPHSASFLDGVGRSQLALACVDAAVRNLGQVRGFDAEAVGRCRRHVEAENFLYTWASKWKASPSRRHQARAAFRLSGEDGFGRVQLQIRGKGPDELLATSSDAVAFCTANGFRRSAATLSWHSATEVSMTPYGGWPPSGQVVASEDQGGWSFLVRDDVRVRQPTAGRLAPARLPEVVIVDRPGFRQP